MNNIEPTNNCQGCYYDVIVTEDPDSGAHYNGDWYCKNCLAAMLIELQHLAPNTWHTYDLARIVLCAACGIGEQHICPDCDGARLERIAGLR